MFINMNEEDLFEFFQADPVNIIDEEAGEIMYSISINNVEMINVISTYENTVSISINVNDKLLFTHKLSGVTKVEADASSLRLFTNNITINIKKSDYLYIAIDDNR